MITFGAIEATRLETAFLETEVRNRTDTNHCALIFLKVPYRHERRVRPGGPGFQRDIPFLRLLVVSKGREVVVVFVTLSHDAPPKERTRTWSVMRIALCQTQRPESSEEDRIWNQNRELGVGPQSNAPSAVRFL